MSREYIEHMEVLKQEYVTKLANLKFDRSKIHAMKVSVYKQRIAEIQCDIDRTKRNFAYNEGLGSERFRQ